MHLKIWVSDFHPQIFSIFCFSEDIHFLHEKQTWFFDKLDVNFGKELLYWNGPHIGQFLIIRNNFSYTICYVCQMEDLMVIRERKIIFDISKPENGFRFSPIEKPKRWETLR